MHGKLCTLLAAVALLALATPAQADWDSNRHHGHHGHHGNYQPRHHHGHDNVWVTYNDYYPGYYYAPRPVYYDPPPAYYGYPPAYFMGVPLYGLGLSVNIR
ncbi:MAG: hypothetical protein ACAH83_17630 [Alphaproteobacteria bacterium]